MNAPRPSAHWLAELVAHLARGQAVMLLTVARTQGSAPREAGASMLVTADETALTIGGGHLEWQAVAHARHRLDAAEAAPELVRYNLGARLGQCCGGVVWLLYEKIPATALAEWQAYLAAVDRGAGLQRRLARTAAASGWSVKAQAAPGITLQGGPEDWHLTQDFAVDRFPVWIFGAGHVAQALVRQLRALDAQITWIDSRENAFTDVDIDGLQTLITDTPESDVARAPAGTFFLIMTHSHTLDFALCEAVYRRHDFAYFGLIGSRSKRFSFEHRLVDRGLPPDRLNELTCPIGIAGIVSKQPAAIALAVSAQLLQIHTARQLLSQAAHPHLAGKPVNSE